MSDIEGGNAAGFVDRFLRSPNPTPIHLIPDSKPEQAERWDIIDVLLKDHQAAKCVVELEVGRYDQDVEKVQLPLVAYLEWLKDGREGGKMNGKQVYLAQWRGLEEVDVIRYHPANLLKVC